MKTTKCFWTYYEEKDTLRCSDIRQNFWEKNNGNAKRQIPGWLGHNVIIGQKKYRSDPDSTDCVRWPTMTTYFISIVYDDLNQKKMQCTYLFSKSLKTLKAASASVTSLSTSMWSLSVFLYRFKTALEIRHIVRMWSPCLQNLIDWWISS